MIHFVEFAPSPVIPHKKVSHPPRLETIPEEDPQQYHQQILFQLAIAFKFFFSTTVSKPNEMNMIRSHVQ
ncbi:hypothetical protein Fmac_006339 [Flemingia macrophylla]|uniref:Uncharacterized protein n=1 Tax=Flemingia macrophylla TaxID=520843 RepID=A0ABD1NAA6_9FABA